jgi:hypothetical protein
VAWVEATPPCGGKQEGWEAPTVKGADKIQVSQISKSPYLEVLGVADGFSHLHDGSLDEVWLVLWNVRKPHAV